MSDEAGQSWPLRGVWAGLGPVAHLTQLKERASAGVDAMDTGKIAEPTPQNHDEAFLQMSWAAEAADRSTRDYRSVFNAYTHKFHQPKPPIGELASAQGAITQSFAKRYTTMTVGAIEALLRDRSVVVHPEAVILLRVILAQTHPISATRAHSRSLDVFGLVSLKDKSELLALNELAISTAIWPRRAGSAIRSTRSSM